MLVPVRCFTCGKILGNKMEYYLRRLLEEKFKKDLLTKAIINTNIKDKDLEPFKDLNNAALFRGGATYADAISFGSDIIDKKLVSEFSSVKGKKVIPFNGWDSDLTEYLDLYNELAGK